jgi:hypothetical protein
MPRGGKHCENKITHNITKRRKVEVEITCQKRNGTNKTKSLDK